MIKKVVVDSTEKLEIIDLMTGMGETWSLLKRNFPNSNLTGLDISEGMLIRARTKNKSAFQNSITVTKQNVLKNKFIITLAICPFFKIILDMVVQTFCILWDFA